MLTKTLVLVAFVLAVCSLGIEGIKTGGDVNTFAIDHFSRSIEPLSDLIPRSECFSSFSNNQADAVNKMGDNWLMCEDDESSAHTRIQDDLWAFTFEIAKVPNDICVKIDDDCRNEFAKDADIAKALKCYAKVPTYARPKLIKMGEDCKMKGLSVENEARLVKTTRQTCTNSATYEYLRASDANYKNFVETCERVHLDSSTSTTISVPSTTSQSPIESSTKLSTTSEASTTTVSTSTESTSTVSPSTVAWETPRTTKKGRFPFN